MPEGEWIISYKTARIKYSITLTDEELVRHDSRLLIPLTKLVRRAETDELRELPGGHLTDNITEGKIE